MADISDFQVNQDALPVILFHPRTKEDLLDDKDKPMTIYVHGLDSKIGTTASKEIKSQRREGQTISDAQVEKDTINLLARCTSRFENLQMNGEHLDCTHKSASELYKKYNWIFEQVAEFLGVKSNHLGNSQKD